MSGVYLTEIWGPADSTRVCPRGVPWEVDENGEVTRVLWPCRRNDCLACSREKVSTLARRIKRETPTHLVTVTHVPASWPEARDAMAHFRRTLKADWDYAMVWAIERDPDPTSSTAHIHGFAKGRTPTRPALNRAASRAGLGLVHRERITHSYNLGYGIKQATHNRASYADYRDLNGSQLWHGGRGYWSPR